MKLNLKTEEGFTLIELLVVIIVIGILAAIALPAFLNQANKAKETESKQYVGALNRAQQAYFLEKASFASDFSVLALGIATETTNFTYEIEASEHQVVNFSKPANPSAVRAHTGGVQKIDLRGTNESATSAVLCQSAAPNAGSASGVTFSEDGPQCNQPSFVPLN